MAYIPPHKRRSKDHASKATSSPRPELLSPVSMRNPNPRSPSSRNPATQSILGIVYANKVVKKWFAVGLDDRNQLPSSVRLQAVPIEDFNRKLGEKSLAFINTELEGESSSEVSERPWIQIAENVTRDLTSSSEHVMREVENRGVEAVKPTLVARFGKIIFRSSSSHESVTESSYCEDTMRKLIRFLHTKIPKSYMDFIVEEGAKRTGLELKGEKIVYRVQLTDSSRSDSTISCKCRVVSEDGRLQLCKVELSPLRYMVIDISCLVKNVDLRLMLNTKRNAINDLTDDDVQNIEDLIGSAIVDPEVKGGLRWPFGKSVSGDKFTLSRIWRIKTRTSVNSSMKLKVRDCDRFDIGTSNGEYSREVFVELKKIASKLKEPDVDGNLLKEMLQDDLKRLWQSFFCCESFLKW